MKQLRLILSALLALSLCLGILTGFAAADEKLEFQSVWLYADPEQEGTRSELQSVNGVNYLFLSAQEGSTAASLYFKLNDASALTAVRGELSACGVNSGETIDLKELCGEGETYRITLLAQAGSKSCELEVTVVPITGVASMYLTSDDPVEHGREWVEASPDKSNKATGSMVMTAPDGEIVYNGELKQIKGRGNSTWLDAKKPYQIKLKDKADLLQTGEKKNAAKTWVLLTNATDPSLIRNNIVYDLSVAMNMVPGIECRPVNLYYDGEYRGAYLLCEKVEINKGRVPIEDLEEAFENANPDVTDFDALTVKTGTTAGGTVYRYCEGIKNPEVLTGGYLLEMDTAARAAQEKCYFTTTRGQNVVVKSPEYCSKEAMEYIASYYQEFEDTLYHAGKNPDNQKTLADYMSVESAVQCYIINELSKNPDGYRTSSYLYKDAGSDVMTMGPVWDYDLSFGTSWGMYTQPCQDPEQFFTLRSEFGKALYACDEYRQAVHDIYLDTVAPLVSDILLGGKGEGDSALQSLDGYQKELNSSAAANAIVWNASKAAWAENISGLRTYITQRNAWLSAELAKWNDQTMEPISGYIDVKESDWFYPEVSKASDYGLMNGMSNGIFAPQENTTRAQAAKVLYALSGSDSKEFKPVFTDVLKTDWFAVPVTWAQANKVVQGRGDGTFGPNESITRQDMVVLLYRYLGEPTVTSNQLGSFSDSGAVADYARSAVRWAIENELLKGYEDRTLRPNANITRAEFAALIVRFSDQFAEHK